MTPKKSRLRGWDLSGENRAGILRRIPPRMCKTVNGWVATQSVTKRCDFGPLGFRAQLAHPWPSQSLQAPPTTGGLRPPDPPPKVGCLPAASRAQGPQGCACWARNPKGPQITPFCHQSGRHPTILDILGGLMRRISARISPDRSNPLNLNKVGCLPAASRAQGPRAPGP